MHETAKPEAESATGVKIAKQRAISGSGQATMASPVTSHLERGCQRETTLVHTSDDVRATVALIN